MIWTLFVLLATCIQASWSPWSYWDSTYMSPTNVTEKIGVSVIQQGGNKKKLSYLNGNIMKGAIPINFIFYGKNWSPDAVYKFQNVIRHLDKSDYFNVLKSFKDRLGDSVTGPILMDNTIMISNIHGNNLSDYQVVEAIKRSFPITNMNAQYIFFLDSMTKVTVGKMASCDYFCGYHRSRDGLKYSVIMDASACPNRRCLPSSDTPNYDPRVDGSTTTLLHEIFESISDPHFDAYIDEDGYEMGDKCNFNFGPSIGKDRNGMNYNIIFGHLKYKVQQMWSIVQNACVMKE